MAHVYRRPWDYAVRRRRPGPKQFTFSVKRGEYGLVYRRGDADNYWHAWIDKVNSQLNLDKVVATVRTNVAQVDVSDVTGDARVIVQGDRHRVWWNFVLLIDETDSDLNTNTGAGLGVNEAANAVLVDNFYAQALEVVAS